MLFAAAGQSAELLQLLCLVVACAVTCAAGRPTTVLIDSDGASMMDDAFAIALVISDPDLDLALVVASSRDTSHKAAYLAATLSALGRPDIPVAIGVPTRPLVYPSWDRCCNGTCLETGCAAGYFVGPLLPWLHSQPLQAPAINTRDFAVQMASYVQLNSPEHVHLLSIGPMTNTAEFARRFPELIPSVKLTAMAGWLNKGYSGSYAGSAEYNIASDIAAAAKVLALPWASITLVPLDTSSEVQLTGSSWQSLLSSQAAAPQLLLQQYRTWWRPCAQTGGVFWCSANGPHDNPSNASSVLYDLQAAYMLSSWEGLRVEEMQLRVNSSGFLQPCNASRACSRVNISTHWRLSGKQLFYERVVSRIVSSRSPGHDLVPS